MVVCVCCCVAGCLLCVVYGVLFRLCCEFVVWLLLCGCLVMFYCVSMWLLVVGCFASCVLLVASRLRVVGCCLVSVVCWFLSLLLLLRVVRVRCVLFGVCCVFCSLCVVCRLPFV